MLTLLVGLALTASPVTADSPYCEPDVGIVTDCIAVQLPDEHEGAELDCPDGQVGTVVGGEVVCPEPVPAPVVEAPAVVEPVTPAAPTPVQPPATTAPATVAPAPAPHTPAPSARTTRPVPLAAAPAEAPVAVQAPAPVVTAAPEPADDMVALRAFIPDYFRMHRLVSH